MTSPALSSNPLALETLESPTYTMPVLAASALMATGLLVG